ncbi:M24 family metallopeptidase [Salimicrobium halophilum]|uniref:Xaa-Pro aminopeptidase n=1 Tax=Salimicrobium halophilum TaxID=86666 RepID=A0A1G8PU82_9BACI|nr:Xaa-Pro peptidase family protein [Salimicrobium halophilum]SDI95983.1 Xaa-Pro aminopeptidase [Salimicrobium halophilum]
MLHVERIRESMKNKNIDALLVVSDKNRRYITGFTGTSGAVLITATSAKLVTDFRYIEQAEDQVEDFEIVEHKGPMSKEIATQLKKDEVKRIGFEKDHMTYGVYETFQAAIDGEMIPVSGMVEELRLVKTDEEISILRDAAKIADEAFDHILSFIKPGVREIDVSNELEFFMRKKGATSSSFDIIVASGYRSALPHGVASEKKIESGELVTLDFGALYKGYCSDITRTIAVGEISEKQKEIYSTVLEAQKAGMNGLRAGLTGKEADALTRDVINAKGYGQYFGHSTGHGIGLDVHEGPGLSHRSDVELKPGMVVTVEPGIYVQGIGGCRIEDDTVITESGNEPLNDSPKELIIL